MGICSSCDSTAVATAKLILPDGSLQEFSYPVKVSYVLQKHPSTFICNSDEMEFDDVVSAVNEEEVLQLGQLYFALPVSRLRRRLKPEEMAALAVKASSALAKSGGDKCLYFTPACSSNAKSSGRVSDVGSVGSRGRSGGRRRNFTAMLSAIPE
ncbi:hypothetical protein HanRHA438_Chr14g0662391 [Helianthus annuus]|uniref:Uncharacterized protein n=1 Tax=Helianthus annuus TaxID=4232 RepID=A0A251SK33_HELAN|nr:uncharacterized protein LOC110905925 [Helianthus annuus]KAF5769734.1 hypothetical protein HanXRQr2_Chr14g0651681 [Helianthus annuus]KAJ0464702.1 hypothetical protein HanHA300_Chr14g0530251 [Helianthus annuus]KAJ0469351.1 hypothetical protein HanIR_Chr14g0706941 [Helianthus annuus]KAJ0486300.1 hypothetical protein HanHA89_Chr14g0578131 [Helianthus annuus]KAJ0656851.1 hypothetical protein HanLR1_Chr14g0540541 [Helianthus annuus]